MKDSRAKALARRFVFVALSAVASTAFASDGKVYHGVFCQPFYGTQQGDFTQAWSGITNTSNGYRTVTCPIIKDNIAGTKLVEVGITYTKVDSCVLSVTQKDGSGGYSYTNSNPCATCSGYTYEAVAWNKTMYSGGNASLYCTLAPGGEIRSYYVEEE